MNNISSKTLSTQRWITLLVVMLTSMGLTGPATAAVLVSNFGETLTDNVAPTSGLYKQSFRTGVSSTGYMLERIQIDFGGTSNNAPEVTVLNPDGSRLTRLHRTWDGMGQKGIEGSNDVFARWPGIPLKRNTEYTITVKGDSNFSGIHIQRASTNMEDTNKSLGWSIGDSSTASNSSWRIKVTGTVPKLDPRKPFLSRGLSATAISNHQIELSWDPNRIRFYDPNRKDNWKQKVTGHRIEVSNDGVTGWTDVVANTGDPKREYTHKGIPPSTTRHYRVSAINRIGTGVASASANATTLPWNNSPSEPRNLRAKEMAGNTVRLRWNEPLRRGDSPVIYYRVEFSPTDADNWKPFKPSITMSGGTIYNLAMGDDLRKAELKACTVYKLRVAAFNRHSSFDDFEYSNVIVIHSGNTAQLSATATSTSKIELSWDTNVCDTVTGYRIEVSDTGGDDWTDLVANTGNLKTEYTHTGIPISTTKYYRVSVINNIGTGTPSTPTSANTSPLTARLDSFITHELTEDGTPIHHALPFTFEMHFSENVPDLSPSTVRDYALSVDFGQVTEAHRLVPRSNQHWGLTIRPDSTDGVFLSVLRSANCQAAGAICAYDKPLTNSRRGTIVHHVSGRLAPTQLQGQVTALTAEFQSVPGEHDGSTAFTFDLIFSEDIPGLGYRTLRDSAFTVTNGRIGSARRLARGSNRTWELTVRPDGTKEVQIALPITTDCQATGAICIGDNPLSTSMATLVPGPSAPAPQEQVTALTAEFRAVPEEHDGSQAFTFELHFSENVPGLNQQTLRDSAFTVTKGNIDSARKLAQGSNQAWELTVSPDGTNEVQVVLPATTNCQATGAICIGDNPLSISTATLISGPPDPPPQEQVTALTAEFRTMPEEHDGSQPFRFELHFSENVPNLSYKTLRDSAFTVTNGRVIEARRLTQGSNQGWAVKVRPTVPETVTVNLPVTTNCAAAGAICMPDDRKLSGVLTAMIAGPPAVSVGDARAREGTDETVEFTVNLSRATSGSVTVDYETVDGTATAGTDYTSTHGTTSFAPGERTKTISVPVLDDAHDEGEETLTLTLSNISGAYLADATATGTIENTDPMPKAWMVRIGRTVGSQAVNALTQRLEGAGKSHVTVAGINVIGASGLEALTEDDDPFGLPKWAKTTGRETDVQTITADDIRLRSTFHLSSDGNGMLWGGPTFTTWGQVATESFETEEKNVTMDGDVTTGFIGFDAEWERGLAGIMLSQSNSEGGYRLEPEGTHGDIGIEDQWAYRDIGTVRSSLTGVYPYARVQINGKVSAWALAGAGSGELTLKQTGKKSMPTDISMRMGAIGVKGEILDGENASGVNLNVKSDAMWVGTKSQRTNEMVATEGDVTRMRFTLQGERTLEIGNSATFTPSAEVGVRLDGGDAETGTGIEVGAGLRYIAGPLTVEGQVRTLIAHETSGYEEWGMNGAIRVTPDDSGRGLTLSVAPAWGHTESATERLWSAHDAREFDADTKFKAKGRIEINAGYGLGLPYGRGVLTPYAGVTLGEGHHTMRTGTRWQVSPDTTFGLEAAQQRSDSNESDNQMTLRIALRF